jgi:hypothetical protein
MQATETEKKEREAHQAKGDLKIAFEQLSWWWWWW